VGPLVSVALATYNGGKYLREQIDSIYNQTYKNIEVIACDDGSNDDTEKILQEYQKRFGLRYCRNERNLGFVKNFEKAIALCKGEYIALCDQDDIWVPEKIEVLIHSLNGKKLICSDLYLINGSKEHIANSLYQYTNLKFYSDKQFERLVHSNFVVGCTVLFKSDLKKFILPFPNGIPYHDWWIAFVASTLGGIEFYERPLVYYRYHGNNNSQTGKKSVVESIMDKLVDVQKKMSSGYYEDKLRWLENISDWGYFTIEQKRYIQQMKIMYEHILTKRMPVRAAIIAIKNRKFILPRRGPFKQFIFTFGILFAGILRAFAKKKVHVTASEAW